MKEFEAKQVINGTWGEIWYDGEYMAEIISCKAEINYKKTAVQQARKLVEGQKVTGMELKGEFKIHHVNSAVMKKENTALKAGKTATHTIITKVDDPDAVGAERVALYDCILDKNILTDFENGKQSERSYPFTFGDWDLLESM